MPIEAAPAGQVSLFLFAHQDDEFGVFHVIEQCRRQGKRAVCAYLTRGADGVAARRNAESRKVLASLGVDERDIVFAGDELGIDDACLHASLDAAGAWIARWIGAFDAVERIHVTAWEGGHHDHDALHALTVRVADRLGLLPRVRQFALYHRHRRPGPLFRVLSPLAANGPVESQPIPFARRLVYLRLCLRYPSQAVTWVGLFPFVFAHYALRGTQDLQAVSLERLRAAPHPGTLYYERRGFYSWDKLRRKLDGWRPAA
ncbi:MAG: N-acetylglucosaminylphosphatidylinositol deacetylase [Massilia sp.]|nr:N-acetylglucosaminylphosphatidylinositol deacetylase [Massilia sp.]